MNSFLSAVQASAPQTAAEGDSTANEGRTPRKRRVALLISSLNYGGAEMQITMLANELARAGHTVTLLVSYAQGPLAERLSRDVALHYLGRRSRWDLIRLTRNLFSELRKGSPEALYAFLPGANLVACLAKARFPKLRVAWGVRASNVKLSEYGWAARLSYWMERRLSRWPDLIVANSAAGRRYAVRNGFPDNEHFIVIPNGIDAQRFRPDAGMRESVRGEWGISPKEILVGIVARLDPMKDYPNFLAAAARLSQSVDEVRFVSVGAGPGELAEVLKRKAKDLGLTDKMIWAGERDDLPAVYNALDVLALSSSGEGFSNVLGEAMACGVPCVATDVGDAREILGEVGVVVPACDAQALAAGILEMLERLRRESEALKVRARQRISEKFSVEELAQRTAEALERVCG